MSAKQYAKRNIVELDKQGGHYCRHVSAMTTEDLHSKSDIAAELAWRDSIIDQLQGHLATERAVHQEFIEHMRRRTTELVEILRKKGYVE